MNEKINLDSFFEQSRSGFLITNQFGIVIHCNASLAAWMGYVPADIAGKRFADLLAIGGKIYYETHLSPLLKIQGFFEEVMIELQGKNNSRQKVLVNAQQSKDQAGEILSVNYTLVKASDRLQYEQNLQLAKNKIETELLSEKETLKLREELIAVLGHDLRNPLNAISIAGQMLAESSLNKQDAILVGAVNRSSRRMAELIGNIMDFARTRLGGGMKIILEHVELKPVLRQVVHELQLVFPGRTILVDFDITEPVHCDPHRVAQLFSNLLANALTHGAAGDPVKVNVYHRDGILQISVSNTGEPISEELQRELFMPFTREANRPSQNGLGLGLYISSEIARAHNAELICASDSNETSFTFKMPAI